MKKLLFLFASITAISFFSCDKVDDPYQQKNIVTDTTTTPVDTSNADQFIDPDLSTLKRNVLIEDFTGHTCGNCPEAAIKAKELKNVYGSQIKIAAVHAGFFAEPYPSGPKYRTDFRTAAGETYNTDFGVSGNPKGMINRTENNGVTVMSPDAWSPAISNIINEAPLFDVQLLKEYDEATDELTLDVGVYTAAEINGSYDLVVYLLEDSIIDYQKDYSEPSGQQDVSDYIHEHVLRDNITPPYGENIILGSKTQGEWIVTNYTYTLPAHVINESHCAIIAYVRNTDTGIIEQVEEAHIVDGH